MRDGKAESYGMLLEIASTKGSQSNRRRDLNWDRNFREIFYAVKQALGAACADHFPPCWTPSRKIFHARSKPCSPQLCCRHRLVFSRDNDSSASSRWYSTAGTSEARPFLDCTRS